MIEIGLQKTIVVRTRDKRSKKLTPVIDTVTGQPETRIVNAKVVRVTRKELDGSFCRDSGRKLVVSLEMGDRLVLRPAGTRQSIDAPLAEVYRWMIFRRASKEHLERARERKAAKQRARESRRITDADRRLRIKAKGEACPS